MRQLVSSEIASAKQPDTYTEEQTSPKRARLSPDQDPLNYDFASDSDDGALPKITTC